MAAKFVLLALFMSAALVSAEDCDCKDRGDTKELWDFLMKLSPNVDNINDEEKEMYSVLPGFLSPLFECDCEKNRRKRDVNTGAEEESASEESTLERFRSGRQRKSIHFGTRYCPSGFAKLGRLCVREEFLE